MSSKEQKKELTVSVLEYLASVPDARVERTRAHPLVNILVIALLAVLCGADSFAAIGEFGRCKKEFLAKFLDLTNGIPSHDTKNREQGTGNREQGTGNRELRPEEASLWRGSLGQLVNRAQGAGSAGGYARAPKRWAARRPLTILGSLHPVDQFSLRGA